LKASSGKGRGLLGSGIGTSTLQLPASGPATTGAAWAPLDAGYARISSQKMARKISAGDALKMQKSGSGAVESCATTKRKQYLAVRCGRKRVFKPQKQISTAPAPELPPENADACGRRRRCDSDDKGSSKRQADITRGRAAAQLCEHCCRALPKRKRGSPGPAKRFCSPTCQKASAREKAAFEVAGYNLSRCPRIASKSVSNSNGCKAQNGHPYPSRFSVPLDVLGGGHRWPGAPKLERKIWEAILWREGCAQ
jgi:hypothetical protein